MKKSYADTILEAVEASRRTDALYSSYGTAPKWPEIYADFEELATRLKRACEILRQRAFYDSFECEKIADELESMPESE